jgi:Ecdysteroid kinase-like family
LTYRLDMENGVIGEPVPGELREQIRLEFEHEERRKATATALTDIPFDFESIAPEWFGHLVCKHHPDARVTAYRLDEPDNGTANRRRVFLGYNAAGEAAGLPRSVFCKATQSLVNRQITASLGFTSGEVNFYNRYRGSLEIEAPQSLLATYDPRSWNSIIVMHDLALDGAKFCHHDTQITQARARNQLELLAKLHGAGFSEQRDRVSELPQFESFFNAMDTTFGFQTICDKGFSDAEEVIPPRLFRRGKEIWSATLKSNAVHAALPRTFTHVDCHLRNWYVKPGDTMGICDFQTFSQGHWAFDVTYAMTTSLAIEDRRVWEQEMLLFYLDALRRHGGPTISLDEARTFYRQHLFVALAWWTSTLTVAITQPRPSILALIERITTAIDDLDALDSLD